LQSLRSADTAHRAKRAEQFLLPRVSEMKWLRKLFMRPSTPPPNEANKPSEASNTLIENQQMAEELEAAKTALESMIRPANLSQLGGFRPEDKSNRFTSWWGCNFLAKAEEDIPVCLDTGLSMHPVMQIKVSELPNIPSYLVDIEYLTLWMALEGSDNMWEKDNGHTFCIRTYKSTDELVPIGQGYREHPTFPSFPIKWNNMEEDLPFWEDFSKEISFTIASSDAADFFDNHPARAKLFEYQQNNPVKVGGYPHWWQSPKHDHREFAFQIESTPKGQIGFYGGTVYFFKTPNEWKMYIQTC
jgi:hypothetical protein